MSHDAPGEEVVISPPERQWIAALLVIFGLIGGLLGIALLADRPPKPGGWILISGGLGLVVVGIAYSLIKRAQRRTLIILEDGFVYGTPGGQQNFSDSDIMCVSYALKRHYSSGELRSITRRFAVWVESEPHPQRILVVNRLRSGRSDPLGSWIQRVIKDLHAEAKQAYEAGQPVEGEGWRLHRGELIVTNKGRNDQHAYAVSELTAVDEVEDHVCVWCHGEELPSIRIPVAKANAHLLQLMMGDLIADDADDKDDGIGHDLGRVIFQRKQASKILIAVLMMFFGVMNLIALFLCVGACVLIAKGDPDGPVMLGAGATMIVIMSLAMWLSWRSRRMVFRCHTKGIRYQGMFQDRRLLYTEVASFTYAATKMYVNGVYTGTNFIMTFTPMTGSGLKPVRLTGQLKGDDTELERLREHVSLVIAGKMLEVFRKEKSVPWLPHVRFNANGIEFRALGFIGRKQAQITPYGQVSGFDFVDGNFRLFTRGQKKPVFTEGTGQPNFYPGLMLMQQLLHDAATAEAGPVEADEEIHEGAVEE